MDIVDKEAKTMFLVSINNFGLKIKAVWAIFSSDRLLFWKLWLSLFLSQNLSWSVAESICLGFIYLLRQTHIVIPIEK